MPELNKSPFANRTAIISIIKVLQHFGVKDVEKLYDKNPETDERFDWIKIKKMADKYNIRSTLIRPTADELIEVEYPAIARMSDGAYITIGSVNDEVVLAIDPRETKPVAIPMKAFLESWNNELMIFSASFSWAYFKKRYNADWFLQVFIHYKKPIIEVLIASFLNRFSAYHTGYYR